MADLRSATTYIIIIICAIAAMVLGDYLGYKIGRVRLATILGPIALVSILGFAIYAAFAAITHA